jgi:hypothetical protein
MAILGATTLTGCNSIPDFIATSTASAFQQTNAPTSWTKDTGINESTLRVVNGTASSGGTANFSAVFTTRTVGGSVDNTTLATTQIPSHQHPAGVSSRNVTGGPGVGAQSGSTGLLGGSQAHNHPFTGTNQDFAVQYVDYIVCTKN